MVVEIYEATWIDGTVGMLTVVCVVTRVVERAGEVKVSDVYIAGAMVEVVMASRVIDSGASLQTSRAFNRVLCNS